MRLKVPPSRSNATHVVDKMLRNAWNVGYISMLLPQACIIQVPNAYQQSCNQLCACLFWQLQSTLLPEACIAQVINAC